MSKKDPKERFWSFVNKTENCWEWVGALKENGYGVFYPGGKIHTVYAHRYSHLINKGDPGELCVLHICDNRKCVNPDHLFLGTYIDNSIDAKRKGRLARGLKVGGVKLTEQIVRDIRARYTKGGITHRELAEEYGVRHYTVQCILKRLTWTHI